MVVVGLRWCVQAWHGRQGTRLMMSCLCRSELGWTRVALAVLCVQWLIFNHASRGRIPQMSLAGLLSPLETFGPVQGVEKKRRFGVCAAWSRGRGHMIKKVESTESAVTHSGSQVAETQGCRWRSSGTMRFFSIKRRSTKRRSAHLPAHLPGCPAWLPWPSDLGAADGPRRAAPCHWPGPGAL